MIINGQYNSAHVMIESIDASTRSQIQNFVNNESFAGGNIAIMPDCHAGKGSCIGFTMPLGRRVVPEVVGVDIGCGILAYKYDMDNLSVRELDEYIKANIPSGFTVHQKQKTNDDGAYLEIADEIEASRDYTMRSIGTLGGGNHFIEAGFGKDGKLWVAVHSGSRKFGLNIAQYYTKLAGEWCTKNQLPVNGIPFLPVDSNDGRGYLRAQGIAARYASENRMAILTSISRHLQAKPIQCIESIHNFIDDTGMIRKGATPAHDGQSLVIPFNMRDGMAICRGKGNLDWNNSAPHGAGRLLSRSQAKKTLDVQDFQDDMQRAGVYTTTANAHTLDEAPGAYKDKDIILDCIRETVDVTDIITPIYNFKASEA